MDAIAPNRVRNGFAPRQAHVGCVTWRSPPQCNRRASSFHACGYIFGARATARTVREPRMIHRAAPRHVVGMFLRQLLHRGAACPSLTNCEQQHDRDDGGL
jgi:hypothetical protein